jgi:hypothetical protein
VGVNVSVETDEANEDLFNPPRGLAGTSSQIEDRASWGSTRLNYLPHPLTGPVLGQKQDQTVMERLKPGSEEEEER